MPNFPSEEILQACERDGDSFGWPVLAPRGAGRITSATFCFHWFRGVGPEWFQADPWLGGESSYHYPLLISAIGMRHGEPPPDPGSVESREIGITVDATQDGKLRTERETWAFDPPVDVVIFAVSPLKGRSIPVPTTPTVELALEGRDQPLTTSPIRPR